MIFILGSQRSGTTWLRDCFAHVVRLDVGNEWYFPALADAVEAHVGTYGRALAAADGQRVVRETVRRAWSALLDGACAGCEADKSAYPSLGFHQPLRLELYSGAIAHTRRFFPDARFVVIVRDPRDVFASLVPFGRLPRPTWNGRSTALQFAENWTQQNTKWLADRPDAWIRYEDLKVDFRATVRSAIESAGVTISDAQLDEIFAKEYDISKTRHREPHVYRTGEVGRWSETLDAQEIADIESTAAPFMSHCGYAVHATRESGDGPGAASDPPATSAMYVDVPARGSTVRQPFDVGGWALDIAASSDTGVDAVHVWLTPHAAGPALFAGAASIGGPRSDVAAIHGEQFLNCAYGLTVDGVPPGAYDLTVRVRSAGAGAFTVEQQLPIVIA
jgi:hypothetical protein